MVKQFIINPSSVTRSVMAFCRQHRDMLLQLMLVPVIISSLVSAWSSAEFYQKLAQIPQADQASDAGQTIDLLTQLSLIDGNIFFSFAIALYFEIAFLRAVILFVLQAPPQPLWRYFLPCKQILSFFGVFIMILLLVTLPGSLVASLFLGVNQSLAGLVGFLFIFLFSALYIFARLSPMLISIAEGKWLGPADAFRFSKVRGFVQTIIMVIALTTMVAIFAQAILSTFALNISAQFNQIALPQTISFNLVTGLISNMISYIAITPIMVVMALVYKVLKQLRDA
ncbi:MAG: hypothetical protein AB8B77_04250 [Alphaproteobacteria bacterium]